MTFRSSSPSFVCLRSKSENQRIHLSLKYSPHSIGLCRVCGDQARINNYGALSCQSCKTFFRRNGFRIKNVRPCVMNECCEVNKQTRQNCTACRLAKCLSIGMSSDRIRKEERKPIRSLTSKQRLEKYGKVKVEQFCLFDLSNTPALSFLPSELTLLSNIAHAYDTFVTKPSLQLSTRLQRSEEELLLHLYDSFYRFISSSPDFRILTTSEQISLLQRNLHGIIGLAFLYSSNQQRHDDIDGHAMVMIFVLVLAFSSNCSPLKMNEEYDCLLYGTYRLYGSQNVYVELLWKWLLHQYGYVDASKELLKMVKMVINVLKCEMINDVIGKKVRRETKERHGNDVNGEMSEIYLLWGKI